MSVFVCFCFENEIIITQRHYSVKNCWKNQQKPANLWQKRYFKNKLKHSKRFDHVTDDVLSLFWSWKKLSGKTLLSRKFSLPCDKRLTLYSSRPSLPTFLFMFITRLNFKCRTSTGYFSMPHTKTQICYLLLTRKWNLVTAKKP